MQAVVIEALVKIALLIGGMMTAAAYLVLLERWIAAWVQDRVGPNRVGIPLTKIKLFGLGQPLADGLKFIFKEEITPHQVDKFLYTLAPLSILAAGLAVFAAIPFGSVLPSDAGISGVEHQIELVVAPGFDVGLIYVFALGSIAVYGVILGGWASNSKYSFLGGLRSSAQLIAYELPMGLGILGVVLFSGSLRLETIIEVQATSGVWNVIYQPLGFVVFLVAAFAESARLPFDHQYASQTEFGKPLVNSCLTLALVTGQSVTDISQNHLIDDRHLPRVDSQLSLEAGRIDPRVLMRSCCIEYLHPTVCRPFSPSGFGQLRKGSARADEDDQAQCQVDGPIGRVGSKRDRQLPGLRNHVWDGVVCVESPAANRVVIGPW